MRNPKRAAAIGSVAAILTAFGIGGAVTAHASTDQQAPIVQQSDGDGEANDATEAPETEEANDGPDQGPDANPNEPGHQDADESGETE
jgi:type IV secretory pathway TrbF-like protein